MPNIDVLQVGVLATNCYVISSDGQNECIVLDPGGQAELIESFLETRNLEPKIYIASHAHADHTGAVAPLVDRYGGEFYAGEADVAGVNNQLSWLVSMLGDFQEPPIPTKGLAHNEVVELGDIEIKVLSTPGHTPGSSSFLVGGHVFTGDTLFRETIGRFDLSEGDEAQEKASIRNILFALDDETVVLPGHGPSTTIGHERVANKFVR